ncbi:MAG TPA: methyltransferase [Pseudonocardiaceae bacterium]
MPSGVPVLVAETVVPPGNTPHYSKLDDIEMLVVAGGADRTESEWTRLLSSAGLRIDRSIACNDRFTLLEAFRA